MVKGTRRVQEGCTKGTKVPRSRKGQGGGHGNGQGNGNETVVRQRKRQESKRGLEKSGDKNGASKGVQEDARGGFVRLHQGY